MEFDEGSRPGRGEQKLLSQIGLVAGWGEFPVEVAESLRAQGTEVYCIAIRGHASRRLESVCSDVCWSGVGKLGAHLRYFRRNHVDQVTMAGKLFKADLLYQGSLWLKHFPDLACVKTLGPCLLGRGRDARDDSLLLAVTAAYQNIGISIVPATDFAPDLLVKQGHLAGRKPVASVQRDIEMGWRIAKKMGGLDIGQAVAVKDGSVIAVEAIEGTDACIERAGRLCPRGGWSLIKVSKPRQDMRFDVPTIGPQTVRRVQEAGGVAIAIEADRTILVERDHTLAAAERAGVTIVSVADPSRLPPRSRDASDATHHAA